jgi:shikimate kinase
VYLIGMPGTGKSSVGRILAERLSRPFVDLDEEVEANAGASVQDVFAERGEPEFRALETAALSRISARNSAVVACGGGIVLDADNRTLMRASGTVVWLNVAAERLQERDLSGRPLLTGPGDLVRLLAEREPLYRETADIELDADADPAAVATALEGMIS